MKNIVDMIYEGILSPIDKTIEKSDNTIKDIYNSYKERFIRIMSASSHMNTAEEITLRRMIDDSCKKRNCKSFVCHIPKKLRDSLIICSDRRLAQKDFNGFSNNAKEYDFACSLELIYLNKLDKRTTSYSNLKALLCGKKNQPVILNNGIEVICLGNALICRYEEMMYIWIEGAYRIVFRVGDYSSNSKHAMPLN